jgi:hypothetical protein
MEATQSQTEGHYKRWSGSKPASHLERLEARERLEANQSQKGGSKPENGSKPASYNPGSSVRWQSDSKKKASLGVALAWELVVWHITVAGFGTEANSQCDSASGSGKRFLLASWTLFSSSPILSLTLRKHSPPAVATRRSDRVKQRSTPSVAPALKIKIPPRGQPFKAIESKAPLLLPARFFSNASTTSLRMRTTP